MLYMQVLVHAQDKNGFGGIYIKNSLKNSVSQSETQNLVSSNISKEHILVSELESKDEKTIKKVDVKEDLEKDNPITQKHIKQEISIMQIQIYCQWALLALITVISIIMTGLYLRKQQAYIINKCKAYWVRRSIGEIPSQIPGRNVSIRAPPRPYDIGKIPTDTERFDVSPRIYNKKKKILMELVNKNGLIIVKFDNIKDNVNFDCCSTCFLQINGQERVTIILKCCHVFHIRCLINNLDLNCKFHQQVCPVCLHRILDENSTKSNPINFSPWKKFENEDHEINNFENYLRQGYLRDNNIDNGQSIQNLCEDNTNAIAYGENSTQNFSVSKTYNININKNENDTKSPKLKKAPLKVPHSSNSKIKKYDIIK